MLESWKYMCSRFTEHREKSKLDHHSGYFYRPVCWESDSLMLKITQSNNKSWLSCCWTFCSCCGSMRGKRHGWWSQQEAGFCQAEARGRRTSSWDSKVTLSWWTTCNKKNLITIAQQVSDKMVKYTASQLRALTVGNKGKLWSIAITMYYNLKVIDIFKWMLSTISGAPSLTKDSWTENWSQWLHLKCEYSSSSALL